MVVSKTAREIVELYETRDPFRICKWLNIHIRFSDLGRVKGFYKKILDEKFIVINNSLSSFDKQFVCAHELGHALLHDEYLNFLTIHSDSRYFKNYEDQANKFAAYLIYDPTVDYDSEYNSDISDETLIKIRDYINEIE